MIDYKIYLPYASDYEKSLLTLLKKGTRESVAAHFQISTRTLERHLKALREKAVKQGFCPDVEMEYICPAGFEVGSIKIDSKGKYVPNFKVSQPENVQLLLGAFAEAFSKKVKPLPKIASPKTTNKDLLNLYTISDFHLGMLSWARETNDDWDLDLATSLLEKAFDEMIFSSPKADECFINILGDFFHTDSILPVTPQSKHVLDSDTRYYKLVEKGVYLLRKMIDSSLQNHKKITVLVAEGNHDQNTAPLVQILLSAVYEKNTRVSVICNPRPYYHYVFGNSMLCFHHGHKRKKGADLTKVFSSDPIFRSDWGSCKYAYGHTGHLHHERVEDGGCLWTQHPTIASRDAHSARSGWSSNRACIAFTYDRRYGEKSSVYIRPDMFADKTNNSN